MRKEKILQLIATGAGVDKSQITRVLTLFDEGATIPFVTRYRKEMSGSLDEVVMTRIKEEDERLADLPVCEICLCSFLK